MAERKEHFPIEAFLYLEGKQRGVRNLVMQRAAKLARDRLPQTEVYAVTCQDVEEEWNETVRIMEEGRAMKLDLAAIRARYVIRPEPDDSEPDTCAKCGNTVLVRDGSEWTEGHSWCDACCNDASEHAREDVPALCDAVEARDKEIERLKAENLTLSYRVVDLEQHVEEACGGGRDY